MEGNRYELHTSLPTVECALLAQSVQKCRQRLAHISPGTIIEMAQAKTERGLDLNHTSKNETICEG